jgi:anaerobic selenocysteine-containing dehydrogenase
MMEPESAPLVMIPRRQKRHLNSRFLELGDHPRILLNAEDAEHAGVQDGNSAIVRSRYGKLQGIVSIDPLCPAA